MLVAAKNLSIGDYTLQAGDPILPKHEAVLPPGRLLQLETSGWVREKIVEDKLEARVAALEAQVAALMKSRAPRGSEPQE